jgi:hypothetical protein
VEFLVFKELPSSANISAPPNLDARALPHRSAPLPRSGFVQWVGPPQSRQVVRAQKQASKTSSLSLATFQVDRTEGQRGRRTIKPCKLIIEAPLAYRAAVSCLLLDNIDGVTIGRTADRT